MLTIGVFDSGFGGLTVLKKVLEKVPDANTEYYADNGRNPYGVRPQDEILCFSRQILDFLREKRVDLAIIACNTATAAAMPAVRDAYPFPVLGVIGSGARGAVAATKKKRVGVIATEFTIKSGAYAEAIKSLDAEVEVIGQPCQRFVRLVEAGVTDGDEARAVVSEGLSGFRGTGIDVLVLGCTHFPLLARVISEVMGRGVTLVDPAEETALEVSRLVKVMSPGLGGPGRQSGVKGAAYHKFYTSGDPETFKRLGSIFLGREIPEVERVVFSSDPVTPTQ